MKRAFTLVELLVVIAIIVVLLSLLVPAMNKAIYQAELAACGARQGALAKILVTYTADFKRAYPRAAAVRNGAHHNLVLSLTEEFRPVLRPYFSLNNYLNCPLNQAVNLDGAKFDGPVPLTAIFSSYSFFFAWQWTDFGTPEKGMFRMGDSFTWTDGKRRQRAFSILVSDFIEENIASGNPFVFSSHPDDAGVLVPTVRQDADPPWTGPGQRVTLSWWIRTAGNQRGLVDRNFAHDDGSVQRIYGQRKGEEDDRFIIVPQVAGASHMNNNFPARRISLPLR